MFISPRQNDGQRLTHSSRPKLSLTFEQFGHQRQPFLHCNLPPLYDHLLLLIISIRHELFQISRNFQCVFQCLQLSFYLHWSFEGFCSAVQAQSFFCKVATSDYQQQKLTILSYKWPPIIEIVCMCVCLDCKHDQFGTHILSLTRVHRPTE